MVDLGVALTWIALSAASARGLSALARAAVADDMEQDLSYAGPLGRELASERVNLAVGDSAYASTPMDSATASA